VHFLVTGILAWGLLLYLYTRQDYATLRYATLRYASTVLSNHAVLHPTHYRIPFLILRSLLRLHTIGTLSLHAPPTPRVVQIQHPVVFPVARQHHDCPSSLPSIRDELVRHEPLSVREGVDRVVLQCVGGDGYFLRG
jgi:hypothetical protein